MISTDELIKWAKTLHSNVSINAFDATYRKFQTHSNNCSNITLVYIIKDHHGYPITDKKLKLLASKANQGGCESLLKHMSDMIWRKRHENITKIDSVNEIFELEKENSVIILLEKGNMDEAIETYCLKTNFYVEYLHWNNKGILDGFIDHDKNMYVLYDEYDTRKSICDNLFNKFKTRLYLE